MSVRPQPPNQRENKWPESRARRSRRAAGALRSGGRADAVPFGRARAALGSLGARPGWMRMRSPSRGPRRRCERRPQPPASREKLLLLARQLLAKSRGGRSLEPRHGSASGRQVGLGPLVGSSVSDLSVLDLDRLDRSGSQGPPVHGVESCGCGRGC